MNRGQAVILGIFGVSLLAAGFSMWFRFVQTRAVLEFWGTEVASLIADPEQIELWQLESSPEVATVAADQATIDGKTYVAAKKRVVTKAPGFTNARHALTVDRSFDWAAGDCSPLWSHALVFSRDGRRAIVAFSLEPECSLVRPVGGERSAGIAPIAEGLVTLFEEQLGS